MEVECPSAKEDVKDELPGEDLQTIHDKKTAVYPDLDVADYQQDKYSNKSVFGRVAAANPARTLHANYQDSCHEEGTFYQDSNKYQNIENGS